MRTIVSPRSGETQSADWPADDRARLRGSSARGGLVAVSAEGARMVIGVVSTAVLARSLPPSDFGLVAMVMPLLAFSELLKGFGLPTATVQRDGLERGDVNTLFWASLLIGVLLAGLMALVAPLVGRFYADTRTAQIALAFALVPLLNGMVAQHHALLERQMRFGLVTAIEVAGALCGALVAISMAMAGAGFWALVLGTVATAGSTTALTWALADWRPGRPGRLEALRDMVRFGRGLTGFRVVNYFARNSDDLLIGRYVGADQLGLYSKAYALLLLPIGLIRTPLTRVTLPVLSRLQGHPAAFRRYVLDALTTVVALSVPVVGICFIVADELIGFILGDAWLGAVPVFRILSLAALVQSFNVVTGWIYTALGQTDRWFRWSIVTSATIVLSFIAGLRWGIEGVATAYALAVVITLYPSLRHCFARAPLAVSDVFVAVWRPFAAGAFGILAAGAVRAVVVPVAGSVACLTAATVAFVAAYVAAWFALPGGRRFLRRVITWEMAEAS